MQPSPRAGTVGPLRPRVRVGRDILAVYIGVSVRCLSGYVSGGVFVRCLSGYVNVLVECLLGKRSRQRWGSGLYNAAIPSLGGGGGRGRAISGSVDSEAG